VNLRIVSNSTPLIALARIKRFSLLQKLFGEIIIPQAVYAEVVNASKGRPGSKELENADWIHCHQVSNRDLVTFLKISLDAGEAEAIALAKGIGADLLILDDGDGRNIAESVGITFTGTVGLLLRYYRGHPTDFKDALDELLAQGFRFSKKDYNKVLEQLS
jgi:predicted nucleic acid-binding protein